MSATVCDECGGRRLIAEQTGWREMVVHAFSCSHRTEGDPARCDYSKCRAPLPHDLVVEAGKKTCDTPCRNAAWKERTGYGHPSDPSSPSMPVRTASERKPSKGSGRQVSYPKALDGCFDALIEAGVDRDTAELLTQKHMRPKLSAKQLAELEASEREDTEPESAPMVLPAMVMEPSVAAVPDPPAGDEPHVTIFQRQRGERDELVWVEVDRMVWRGKPEVALQIWLADADPEPLPGGYRAEGNGGSAEMVVESAAA